MAEQMDRWMEKYADIVERSFTKADRNYPGTGAAGGLGFAFLTFTDSILKSGVQIVLEETGMEKKIKEADIVVTGEGRLDGQTAMGKSAGWHCKAGKEISKTSDCFFWQCCRGSEKV